MILVLNCQTSLKLLSLDSAIDQQRIEREEEEQLEEAIRLSLEQPAFGKEFLIKTLAPQDRINTELLNLIFSG